MNLIDWAHYQMPPKLAAHFLDEVRKQHGSGYAEETRASETSRYLVDRSLTWSITSNPSIWSRIHDFIVRINSKGQIESSSPKIKLEELVPAYIPEPIRKNFLHVFTKAGRSVSLYDREEDWRYYFMECLSEERSLSTGRKQVLRRVIEEESFSYRSLEFIKTLVEKKKEEYSIKNPSYNEAARSEELIEKYRRAVQDGHLPLSLIELGLI